MSIREAERVSSEGQTGVFLEELGHRGVTAGFVGRLGRNDENVVIRDAETGREGGRVGRENGQIGATGLSSEGAEPRRADCGLGRVLIFVARVDHREEAENDNEGHRSVVVHGARLAVGLATTSGSNSTNPFTCSAFCHVSRLLKREQFGELPLT